MAQVVGSLIHHETTALHPDGVAAVEVGVKVSTVAHALMVPTLEISVFVEYDLRTWQCRSNDSLSAHNVKNISRFHPIVSVKNKKNISLPFP